MITKRFAREYRVRHKRRIRSRISGTEARQRLSIFRSGKHMYAQIIDDVQGHTLVAASSLDKAIDAVGNDTSGRKVNVAEAVGKLVGERALAAGITKVAFDRNGFVYHGRVKALADGARDAGLDF